MKDQDGGQLEDIRRLLILLLVKLGSDSKEIGSVLGTDSSVIRRLVPARGVKRITFGSED